MTALTLDAGVGKPIRDRVLRGLALPALLVIGWEAASRLGAIDARLLPGPAAVMARAWTEAVAGRLGPAIAASLGRDLLGFAIGAAAGVLVGLALGLSRTLGRGIGPTFNAFRQTAVFAWIPLISVWFGVGEAAKVAFIALAAFTPVVLNTWSGVRAVPHALSEVAAVLRLSGLERARRLVLPAAAPAIFVGLHLGLITSWLATVGAEYFMTVGPGIGSLMIAGREQFEIDLVMVGVLLLGAIGLALNLVAGRIEDRALAWRR